MKRRSFLKKSGKAAASMMAMPYIMPSGRAFARSGERIANHVVYVLFGGGIRNQEAVGKQFLANQSGSTTTGNVMRNILHGSHISDSDIWFDQWPKVVGESLVKQGTLFKNMRYASGPTGHYNGHTVAITGNYTNTSLNLNVNPEFPTVFEYYRKHNDPVRSAMNSWWMSVELGPYPSLNYSRHPQYGALYGANYMMPVEAEGAVSTNYFGGLSSYHPDEQARIGGMQNFLNNHFNQTGAQIPGIHNSAADQQAIKELYLKIVNEDYAAGDLPVPPGCTDWCRTGDLKNITMAWQVLDNFAPELMVINTTNLDVCHDDFSAYIENLHYADYGIGWLWEKIQSHPVLANDTVMVLMPEHGRNMEPNELVDANGFRAYDHTNDENSRDIFGLIVGPPGKIKQDEVVGNAGNPVGESIDMVPTIARILGFNQDIPNGFLPGRVLEEAFV